MLLLSNVFFLIISKDPKERNHAPPETNEKEFCVMLSSEGIDKLQTSIKKIFGRCNYIEILERCPIPSQVKKGM